MNADERRWFVDVICISANSPAPIICTGTLPCLPRHLRSSAFICGSIAFALQLAQGTKQLCLSRELALHRRFRGEFRHAPTAAAGDDLDAQLLARDHRALEARAVD